MWWWGTSGFCKRRRWVILGSVYWNIGYPGHIFYQFLFSLIFTFVVLLHLSPGYIYSPNFSSPHFFTFSALLPFSWAYIHPISFPQMAYCCKYCLSTQDIPLQSLFKPIFMSIVLSVIMKAEDIFFRSCVKCIIPGINARRRFWSKFKRWLGVVSPRFGL